MAHLVLLAQLVQEDFLVNQVLLDPRERLVARASPVLLAQLVLLVHMVRKAKRVPVVSLALLVHPDLQV